MSRSSFVWARLLVASVMFGRAGGLSGDARRWFLRGGLPSSADELWPLSRSQSISRPELLSGAARRPRTSDISSSKRAASIVIWLRRARRPVLAALGTHCPGALGGSELSARDGCDRYKHSSAVVACYGSAQAAAAACFVTILLQKPVPH